MSFFSSPSTNRTNMAQHHLWLFRNSSERGRNGFDEGYDHGIVASSLKKIAVSLAVIGFGGSWGRELVEFEPDLKGSSSSSILCNIRSSHRGAGIAV